MTPFPPDLPPSVHDPVFDPGADGGPTDPAEWSRRPADPPADGGATVFAPFGSEAAAPTSSDFSLAVEGRYHLEWEIARGAMGVVFKSRDTLFGRDVAVKFLLDTHRNKPDLRRRFFEEARITARLQHPGIVSVYSVGEYLGERPYYVMRLVDGETLGQILADRTDPAADRPRLLRVFSQVCETLGYAHHLGVIHRDLKPANVMVGRFGIVKLMDWGVAKALPHCRLTAIGWADPCGADPVGPDGEDGGTELGRVMGTPAYMCPEQARGEIDRLDERSDVFGLGGILCAILTGHPPYPGTNQAAIYRRASRGDLGETYDRLDRCGADPQLVALAKRCLSANPAERPRDAAELAAEFNAYLESDLRRAERDLVRFFDLSLDLFCIASVDGYFRRVNGNFARVLGYPDEEMTARPFIDFVHPDDVARTRAEMAAMGAGELCVRFMNRYRDVRGAYRWFEWTAKPVLEEGIIFAVARDVTERVRLEDQLRAYEGRG